MNFSPNPNTNDPSATLASRYKGMVKVLPTNFLPPQKFSSTSGSSPLSQINGHANRSSVVVSNDHGSYYNVPRIPPPPPTPPKVNKRISPHGTLTRNGYTIEQNNYDSVPNGFQNTTPVASPFPQSPQQRVAKQYYTPPPPANNPVQSSKTFTTPVSNSIQSSKATPPPFQRQPSMTSCDLLKLHEEMTLLKLELAAMNEPMKEHDEWLKRQTEEVKELLQQQKSLENTMSLSRNNKNGFKISSVPPPPPKSPRPTSQIFQNSTPQPQRVIRPTSLPPAPPPQTPTSLMNGHAPLANTVKRDLETPKLPEEETTAATVNTVNIKRISSKFESKVTSSSPSIHKEYVKKAVTTTKIELPKSTKPPIPSPLKIPECNEKVLKTAKVSLQPELHSSRAPEQGDSRRSSTTKPALSPKPLTTTPGKLRPNIFTDKLTQQPPHEQPSELHSITPVPPTTDFEKAPPPPPPLPKEQPSDPISSPPHPPPTPSCISYPKMATATPGSSPVDQGTPDSPEPSPSPTGQLLEQIRQFNKSGKALRKVEEESTETKGGRKRKNSMHDALQTRFQAFCGNNSDSSSEDELDDDSQWD